MKPAAAQAILKRGLRRIFRSMDFVWRHAPLKRGGTEAKRFAEIYQQLGLAWEYLALQCRHRGGWRKLRDGKFACKVCGLIRGAKEQWLLVPREGKKTIGRRALPNSILIRDSRSSSLRRKLRCFRAGRSVNKSFQSVEVRISFSSSGDNPDAYMPPTMAPMLLPAMKSMGMRFSSMTFSTPTCAEPRAAPPLRTRRQPTHP